MKVNPIIIVDDDEDDVKFLELAFTDADNRCECRCFSSPEPALEYLRTTTEIPLAIISDINMPFMNGLEFKRIINEEMLLANISIPFIFLSTAVSEILVKAANRLSIQGFYKKPDNITDLDMIAKAILNYPANNKSLKEVAAWSY